MAALLNDDAKWIIEKSRQCRKSTPHEPLQQSGSGLPEVNLSCNRACSSSCVASCSAAKSWLILGRTLYPNSFIVQFESYLMERSSRALTEVAIQLHEMLLRFPGESSLWDEMSHMCDAVQSEATDQNTTLLRGIFGELPASVQCSVLLRVCEGGGEIGEVGGGVLSQCRLMLYVLKRHGDQAVEYGVKIADSLLKAEEAAQCKSPVNCYRKYLACDVLPLILNSNSALRLGQSQVLYWIQKTIQFYVCYAVLSHSTDVTSSAPSSGLSKLKSPIRPPLGPSPSRPDVFGGRGSLIEGLRDKEGKVGDPWVELGKFMKAVAGLLGWVRDSGHDEILNSGSDDVMGQWEELKTLASSPAPNSSSILCYSFILFFHSLIGYSHLSNNISTHQMTTPVLMLQCCSDSPASAACGLEPRMKQTSRDSSLPVVGLCTVQPVSSGERLRDYFTVACNCWSLLNSTQLECGFLELLHAWTFEEWQWFDYFQIDFHIYQGLYQEALSRLELLAQRQQQQQHKSGSQRDHTDVRNLCVELRVNLQMVCCYSALQDFTSAGSVLLSVFTLLQYLPDESSANGSVQQHNLAAGSANNSCQQQSSTAGAAANSSRRLELTAMKAKPLLNFCIHGLIACLKHRAVGTIVPDDMILGHMLILMQYDLSMYETLFNDLMKLIRHKGSFTYPQFLNYIINIDILEELCYLVTSSGGNVNLQLFNTHQQTLPLARSVTRGVNRGVMEDLRQAVDKQVMRCYDDLNKLLLSFISDHSQLILNSLTNKH